MYHPTRGGTRGGQADFKWTDVKQDKDRENYLGHSINAPQGRWQNNQDIHWYSRDNADSATSTLDDARKAREEELRKIKEQEEDALAVALGFKPVVRDGVDGEGTGANSVVVPKSEKQLEVERLEKEERKRAKELKRQQREVKQLEKEFNREYKAQKKAERRALPEKEHRHDGHRDHQDRHDARYRSLSPDHRGEHRYAGDNYGDEHRRTRREHRSRSREPRHRSRTPEQGKSYRKVDERDRGERMVNGRREGDENRRERHSDRERRYNDGGTHGIGRAHGYARGSPRREKLGKREDRGATPPSADLRRRGAASERKDELKPEGYHLTIKDEDN